MITVDGINFYNSKQGYLLGSVNGKPKRLHVYIWEKECGEIPKGHHIHHIDHDKTNNNLSNLKLLNYSDHAKEHLDTEACRKSIEIARQYAIDWHKSEKSSDFHKQHYQKYASKIWFEPVTKKCEYCGKEYETVHSKFNSSKYCSNNCKSAVRRKSGIDNIIVKCLNCGKEFSTNKYNVKKYCSKDCRAKYHHQN